ncbi:hypothetical protein [Jannaschia seohaensis]|uniref:Uncharacterized protein n=1 Tax=Jannaschia seohaensis TaxID=475081 RepID=A0A2Y9AF33_9RHOB|nr:hypothetical protein [Jannaschia seohaensis]PWJ21345.1 hypothetical protein BCF38_102597 [Jannaschia seohaensis]SSA41888.1 hypothetical protein SAMN05421539_102597 [Jannaschia seohaensis]
MRGAPIRPSRAASDAQRRAWRRDRVRDAACLLPVFGLALILLPDLILADPEAGQGATRPWGLYLFGAWALLVALAVCVARALAKTDSSSSDG